MNTLKIGITKWNLHINSMSSTLSTHRERKKCYILDAHSLNSHTHTQSGQKIVIICLRVCFIFAYFKWITMWTRVYFVLSVCFEQICWERFIWSVNVDVLSVWMCVCVCLSIDGVLKLTKWRRRRWKRCDSDDEWGSIRIFNFFSACFLFFRSFSHLIDCIFNFFSYSEIYAYVCLYFLLFFFIIYFAYLFCRSRRTLRIALAFSVRVV